MLLLEENEIKDEHNLDTTHVDSSFSSSTILMNSSDNNKGSTSVSNVYSTKVQKGTNKPCSLQLCTHFPKAVRAHDFLTHHILFRCDSSSDLYLVPKPSTTLSAFLSIGPTTWHQNLDILYAMEILGCAYMFNCNPYRNLVDIESKLGPDGVMGFRLMIILYTVILQISDCNYMLLLLVLLSNAKAEYRSVAKSIVKTAWSWNLLRETNHIEIDIHFVRDMVATQVLHVPYA
ncbi:hypothetical protein Tco_0752778 [Tanacetum coccineum]|uniref:Uncharacterized protein n=1 Tax=Tanacetum coccineum TaxID=301880 RepID=A0ABQ4Z8Q1_9ASTR